MQLARNNWLKWFVVIGLIAGTSALFVRPTIAEDSSQADTAWNALERSRQPLSPPKEFQTTQPSDDQIKEFYGRQAAHANKAADAAKSFYTKFKDDKRAGEARMLEYQLLGAIMQLGDKSVAERKRLLEEELVADESIPEADRISLLMSSAVGIIRSAGDDEDILDVFTRAADATLKIANQFPDSTDPAALMLELSGYLSNLGASEKAIELLRRVADGPYPEQYKQHAQSSLKPFENVGKLLDVQFTAIDGRNVNISNLKGKVVLLDFWATWCGPCMAGLPELVETYDTFHDQGFEILGISADSDLDALTGIVDQYEIKWPQFFDADNEYNRIAQQYGVTAYPTLWLVDKQGKLHDLNGRIDLAAKVEKMLAE